MKVFSYTFLLGSLLFGLLACGGASEERQETVETILPDEEATVTILPLAEVDFQHELISNGKLAAKRRVDLRFESPELIAHIYVKNGDRVRKGMKLAELDGFKLQNQVDQALDALEKSKLEVQDVLIGQGYMLADSAKVPAATLKLARLKSGYDQAYWNYVRTGLENADSYTIVEGLKAGDQVITTGNINLAHEAPVMVVDNIDSL